jgi:tungstate transport system ATP-binding protein
MSGLPAVDPVALAKPCFELKAVQVRLGRGPVPTLHDIHLCIRPGERVALVGANGSGKSTLLRALHGLLPLSAGQMLTPPRQRVAMLFQRPHLLRLSVLRNIALGLWLQGMPWKTARERAQLALQKVELSALAGRSGRALSGGQQQRVALARVWAIDPDVWLLDEPTASLDPHAKREVEALIDAFTGHGANGRATPPTLVFSSHNLGQVKRLATRVVYLEQGRLLADLPVHDFFDHDLLRAQCPQAHLFVQGESL